jgi:hypothetical protein
MNISKNAFLFNPHFYSGGRAVFHRLVLAELRRARGVQVLCSRCSRSCKVLSGKNSKFFCFNQKSKGRARVEAEGDGAGRGLCA